MEEEIEVGLQEADLDSEPRSYVEAFLQEMQKRSKVRCQSKDGLEEMVGWVLRRGRRTRPSTGSS